MKDVGAGGERAVHLTLRRGGVGMGWKHEQIPCTLVDQGCGERSCHDVVSGRQVLVGLELVEQ
jgi:hypothetical protein